MIDHLVGLGHLEQGASFVTLLPTNGPIRWFARALDPRRLFEPVARRGLAAVRTVQAEPAFKFRDPSLQAAISAACAATSAISSSRDGSLRESEFGFIESLNRKLIPLSRKNYPISYSPNHAT